LNFLEIVNKLRWRIESAFSRLKDFRRIATRYDKLARNYYPSPTLELIRERLRMRGERQGVSALLAKALPGQCFSGMLHNLEHHFADLSSAFHVSPFEEAVILSVDAFGDFSSTAWGIGRGSQLSVDGRVYFPHSLGIFITRELSTLLFPNYGDEYKIMGLALYGQPFRSTRCGRSSVSSVEVRLSSISLISCTRRGLLTIGGTARSRIIGGICADASSC
jgi:carbamoyltransferase